MDAVCGQVLRDLRAQASILYPQSELPSRPIREHETKAPVWSIPRGVEHCRDTMNMTPVLPTDGSDPIESRRGLHAAVYQELSGGPSPESCRCSQHL